MEVPLVPEVLRTTKLLTQTSSLVGAGAAATEAAKKAVKAVKARMLILFGGCFEEIEKW